MTTTHARDLMRGHRGTIRRHQTTTEPLIAATDASYANHVAGYGYLATNGRYGLAGRIHFDPRNTADITGHQHALVAELRAVAFLLAGWPHRTPVTVLVDSAAARAYLTRWQAGRTRSMPAGYDARPRKDGHPAALVQLAHVMATRAGVTIGAVRGHTCHPLNEAADSLAGLARRRLVGEIRADVDVLDIARDHADAALATWHLRPELRDGTARRPA